MDLADPAGDPGKRDSQPVKLFLAEHRLGAEGSKEAGESQKLVPQIPECGFRLAKLPVAVWGNKPGVSQEVGV